MSQSLQINAWLERVDPCVEIRDTKSGNVVLSLHGDILHEVLSNANISHDELLSEKHFLQSFIDELFSQHVSSALGIREDIQDRRRKLDADIIDFSACAERKLDMKALAKGI